MDVIEVHQHPPSGHPVDIERLTPDTWAFVVALDAALRDEGFRPVVRSAYRSCAEQAEQWSIGRMPGDTRKTVTQAQGCKSWHVLGRAVDIDLTPPDYARMGEIAKQLGGKWGGDFKGFPDVGHVEFHPGITIEQACPDPAGCVDREPGELVSPATKRKLAWLPVVAGGIIGGVIAALAALRRS